MNVIAIGESMSIEDKYPLAMRLDSRSQVHKRLLNECHHVVR